ncbi:hypothetical protein [Actinopolymorpha alba]|uniref:hypothetical protein n=1 Tax=Actinopolymorpha alba TaxID=533267 RepID=UPI000382A7D8|nr:hypothetical protein [Actinopolymorpha alba]
MRDVEGTSALATFTTNALRRHLILLLALGVLGAAAGVAFALYQGVSYTATASILVNPLQGNPYAPDGRGEQLMNLETESQLVRTEGVAALAIHKLKTDLTPDELRQAVGVENPTNTQVLKISFTSGSRDAAIAGAQTFAESYLSYRASRAKSVVSTRLARIRKQQSDIQKALGEATAELDDASATRRAYLEERVSALASQLASLETEVSTLTAADSSPGQVISPAALPMTAGGTTAGAFGAGGALGGLLLAAVFALLRARTDNRIHDRSEIERAGVRVLGVVPKGARFSGRAAPARGRVRELTEAYREIRTAIVTSVDAPPIALAVASVSPQISPAPETSGLATGLARAGFSVVVVDTVGEASRLLAGTGSLPGLAELLAGSADLRHVLVQPEDNLVLLPLGKADRQTMDQLLSPQMRSTIKRLREWYDYVIIAGPGAASADGQALASLTDAVVLVAAEQLTTRGEFETAMAALERVQAMPVGAVMIEGIRAGRGGGQGPSQDADERTSRSSVSGAATSTRSAAAGTATTTRSSASSEAAPLSSALPESRSPRARTTDTSQATSTTNASGSQTGPNPTSELPPVGDDSPELPPDLTPRRSRRLDPSNGTQRAAGYVLEIPTGADPTDRGGDAPHGRRRSAEGR